MRRMRSIVAFCLVGVLLALSHQVHATKIRFFVTGEVTGIAGDAIFDVVADPTVAGSAVITTPVFDTRSLDGIALLPGTASEVVVGARGGPPSIAHFNPVAGTTLADFVPNTDLVAGAGVGTTSPSSVLATGTHVYYTENQFGFAGALHRIMRVDRVSGVVEKVFDGSDAGAGDLANFEVLNIVDGRLHFFAEDPTPTAAPQRALFNIVLDPVTGLWDGTAPTELLGDLAASPGPLDGSDELAFEPSLGSAGTLFGSNIFNGEVIFYDIGLGAGGTFISGPAIAASFGDLGALAREIDGIRSDGMGHLIFAGRGGVLGSIDIAGVLADGADDGDITILHDSLVTGSGYIFDDLTQIRAAVPEPATSLLTALGLCVVRRASRTQMS